MKLIIGLGNPGKEYQHNRHNVAHLFVEEILNSKFEAPNNFKNSNIKVFKTDCFMNDSGKFVDGLVKKYRGDWENQGDWGNNLFIVHDDLDIPLGQFKIQKGVGPKVHNGILSIEQRLGTKDFWRVRIGTDSRVRSEREKLGDSGKGYVLDDFSKEEMEKLNSVYPKIFVKLKKLINS